jgi:mannose-6-phosphate isomerase class I
MTSNYDKFPAVEISGHAGAAWRGWAAVAVELRSAVAARRAPGGRVVVAVECYTGLHTAEVAGELRRGLAPDLWLETRTAFKPPAEIDRLVAPFLGGDDPLFGFYTNLTLTEFLDAEKVAALRAESGRARGVVVVFGTAALLCCEPDLIVYADMPRWEGQLRQRRNTVSNLGVENATLKGSLKYKRAFFVDWRVCDRLKQDTLARWDYLLDTTAPGDPRLLTGAALRAGLDAAARRPFRVVPFFDPAPWGGQWMKAVCGLDRNVGNFGWCFDCVPEENSLLLRCCEVTVEMPALNLVFHRPRELLGAELVARFGAEFPIRFDFLDTMGGGNLSLQVHPLTAYAREKFGLAYTQDESYYLLDAGPEATVYLGVKAEAKPAEMFQALETAQRGGAPFPAEQFVNRWPAKKHDHFLIPGGTIHCSGANAMVLEISATPYIFTFKLWDWGRLGLDGEPRPINLQHGRANVQWDRDAAFAQRELINRITPLGSDEGWRAERTGLHSREFIETHRHWFTGTAPHDTQGTVNVLNLVEGREAVVESPTGAFAPFAVHYAETFIVPAAAGVYTVRALGGACATIKAFVRPDAPVDLFPNLGNRNG